MGRDSVEPGVDLGSRDFRPTVWLLIYSPCGGFAPEIRQRQFRDLLRLEVELEHGGVLRLVLRAQEQAVRDK